MSARQWLVLAVVIGAAMVLSGVLTLALRSPEETQYRGDFTWTYPPEQRPQPPQHEYMRGFAVSAREEFVYDFKTGILRWPNAPGEYHVMEGKSKIAFEHWLLTTNPPGWFRGMRAR